MIRQKTNMLGKSWRKLLTVMVMSQQMVRCIHGARTPEASWVWERGSLAPIHPNTSDLCQRSPWSRSLQEGSRASPSPSLEVCSAGAETTVDSLDWETLQVLNQNLNFLNAVIVILYICIVLLHNY